MSVKSYSIPESAHPMVRKFYDDVKAIADESNALAERYVREIEELQERYVRPQADIKTRLIALRKKGTEDICKVLGLVHSVDNAYALDSSYLKDCGVAFFQVVEGQPDTAADLGALPGESRPAGSLLN